MHLSLCSPSKSLSQPVERYVFPHFLGLIVFLVCLTSTGLTLAQSIFIQAPYQRQSVVYGTEVPVTVSIGNATTATVSQVEILYNNATTSLGTATTSPYTVTVTIPSTSFIELKAKVTLSNSTTFISPGRIVQGIPATACNTGGNVKSFYVKAGSPTGAGTSLGGSAATPVGSFNRLINDGVNIGGTVVRPLPGDIIYIMAAPTSYTFSDGNSNNNLVFMTRTGLPGCPITIRNMPGERPKLKMTTTSQNAILVPAGVSYVNIQGLEVEGLYTSDVNVNLPAALIQPGSCDGNGAIRPGTPPTNFNGNGITIDGKNGGAVRPHHIAITDNIVHNCSGAGIGAIEADYITIDNNTTYDNSWYTVYSTSGINIFHPWNLPDGQSPTYRNYIRNNKSYGNRLYVPWFSGCRFTDGNGIILDDFKNSQTSSTIRFQEYTGRTLVSNNLVFNNGGSGIHAYKGVRADIVNNTAYKNSLSPDAIGEIYAQESTDINIVNNISRPLDGELTFTTNTGNVGVAYTNNLYLVAAASQVPSSGTGVTVSTNQVIAPSAETDVFVSPTINAATSDFQLKPGSAAINAGTSAYLTAVPADILGIARPQGGGVDLGAYESQYVAPPVTITQQPASNSAVCVGTPVSVSVSTDGPATYQWYKISATETTPVFSATTATLSFAGVSVADQGTYRVVVSGVNTLTSTAFSLTVSDGSGVTLTASNGGRLTCANPGLTLTAGGANGYVFSGGNPAGADQVTVDVAGTYSVTATDAIGCTATASTTVVSSIVSATVSISPTVITRCAGQSALLSATAGLATYQWSNGETTATISATATGIYAVTAANAQGCSASATASVTINAPIAAPTLLTADGQNQVTVPQYSGTVALLPDGCPGGGITWTAPDGSTGTGPISVPTTTTGTFLYQAVCQFSGCTSAPASATVVVNTDQLRVISPLFDCTTGKLTLRTTGGNGQPIEYQIPSVTRGWEAANPVQIDPKEVGRSLKLRARQRAGNNQGYDSAELNYQLPACGSGRLGTSESGNGLSILVLGNPQQGPTVEVEIRGAGGQPLRLQLIDLKGRIVSEKTVEQPRQIEHQQLRLDNQPTGLYLLQASTSTQHVTAKLLRNQ